MSAETIPTGRPARQRLDQLLVERGLAETRARAQALLLGGRVRVGDGDSARRDRKPGDLVDPAIALTVDRPEPYVSRGGHKLAAALDTFALDPAGLVALDVGASTGGFTDVLLQRGAARVYAVDVGRGQLADRLRRDERVVSLERTNARTLAAGRPRRDGGAGGRRRLVHLARSRARADRRLLRFGRRRRSSRSSSRNSRPAGGSPTRGSSAIPRSTSRCSAGWSPPRRSLGLGAVDAIASPILGPEGNREFLLRLVVPAASAAAPARETPTRAADGLTDARLVEVVGQ